MSRTPNFPRTQECCQVVPATPGCTASGTSGPRTVDLRHWKPKISVTLDHHATTTTGPCPVEGQIHFRPSTPRTNGFDAVASDRASAFRVCPAMQRSEEIYSESQKKKRRPFYYCGNFVRCHPILLIFGRNIPEEICSMTAITYLLKNW